MPNYRRKPIKVEAVQWTGDNYAEVYSLVTGKLLMKLTAEFRSFRSILDIHGPHIETAEGDKKINVGDYIIKFQNGKFDKLSEQDFKEQYINEIDTPNRIGVSNYVQA